MQTKRLKDTQFVRTFLESLSELLLQVFMLGGVVVALIAASVIGFWWVFPIAWVAVMVIYFFIHKALTRRQRH